MMQGGPREQATAKTRLYAIGLAMILAANVAMALFLPRADSGGQAAPGGSGTGDPGQWLQDASGTAEGDVAPGDGASGYDMAVGSAWTTLDVLGEDEALSDVDADQRPALVEALAAWFRDSGIDERRRLAVLGGEATETLPGAQAADAAHHDAGLQGADAQAQNVSADTDRFVLFEVEGYGYDVVAEHHSGGSWTITTGNPETGQRVDVATPSQSDGPLTDARGTASWEVELTAVRLPDDHYKPELADADESYLKSWEEQSKDQYERVVAAWCHKNGVSGFSRFATRTVEGEHGDEDMVGAEWVAEGRTTDGRDFTLRIVQSKGGEFLITESSI